MAEWKNIFVFGYGTSRMNGLEKEGNLPNDELSTLAPLISYLATLQQQGTIISLQTLFSLNIYNNYFIDFLPNSATNKTQRFSLADLDMNYVNALADEMAAALPNSLGNGSFLIPEFAHEPHPINESIIFPNR